MEKTEDQIIEEYLALKEKYFEEVMALYGKDTGEYEFKGIEFLPGGSWIKYPEEFMGYPEFGKALRIVLGDGARTSRTNGIFQLSHEVIHLLGPTGSNDANIMEEGLAVYYSILVTSRDTDDQDYALNAISKSTHYYRAYSSYKRLIEIDPEAIRKLRVHCKKISEVTWEHFIAAGLNIPDELVEELLSPMPID